jgi:hypothetical protein
MLPFTLQDITNKLFQYFIDNNVFDLEQNQSDIFEVAIDPILERAALLKSLEKFEEQKICSRLDIDGNPVFLLNQPLQSFKQQIEISGATAAKIASAVNSWIEENGNGKAEYSVNPVDGITEFNLQVLLHIAETAVAQTN